MPTTNDVLAALRPWIERHRRPTWTPVVEKRDGPATGSKFAGTPWLAAGEPWPSCPNCTKPLELFLQLDLGALPMELADTFSHGLLQVFYCHSEEPSCAVALEGWAPFSPCHLVRIVQPRGRGAASAPQGGPAAPFPPRAIVGWEPRQDLPHPPEHETLGLRYHYDFEGKTLRVECPADGIDIPGIPLGTGLEEAIAQAAPGDKLAGWPCWVQGVEYPNCPRCGKPMRLVFQLDSEDHLPFMFDDAGCAHVTQCPEHLDVVALAWACG